MAQKQDTAYAPGTAQDNHGFPTNSVNYIFIDTTPQVNEAGDVDLSDLSTGKWARLAGGISGATYSGNETTTNDQYLDGDGYGDTNVSAKRGSLALTGNRKIGDPAQEFIASKQMSIGNDLRTRIIWIENGQVIITGITMTNIVATGGNANAKQTFSLTLNFNGRPRTVIGTLTMTEKSDEARIYTPALDDAAPTAGTPQGKAIDSASEVTANTDPSANNPADHSNTDTGKTNNDGAPASSDS